MTKKEGKEKPQKNIVGLTVKKENFSEWFQQLIIKSELADYTAVSGCMVFRQKSYAMWEKIKDYVDKKLRKIGIKNVYFPLLIPEKFLIKEKEHVKGFAPEVAWVTHTGDSKLNERLAIRPTSEAIMYPSYKKWIRSYRDLPLKLNQWNNVVRWEFKNPVLFLRTREFLWNEGHTAFASEKEAIKEKNQILKIYQETLKELMALPGFTGRKTQKEKFAGARNSWSIEHILPNGKAIQGPDFHDDGQNFAKAYNIKFLDKNEKEKYVWQNTWAITTRMLGIMFAVHSDDKGLIIPPKLAENKIVIIPIFSKKDKEKILREAKKIKKGLNSFNPILDEREDYSPGWKFNEWELKGIPLRIEIGPKDLKNKSVKAVKRNDNKKLNIKISQLKKKIPKLLEQMHEELYKKAENLMKSKMKKAETLEEAIKIIKAKEIALAPICNKSLCEDYIKEKTGGAKVLNIPENLEKKARHKNKLCIWCKKPASYYVYIGKSY